MIHKLSHTAILRRSVISAINKNDITGRGIFSKPLGTVWSYHYLLDYLESKMEEDPELSLIYNKLNRKLQEFLNKCPDTVDYLSACFSDADGEFVCNKNITITVKNESYINLFFEYFKALDADLITIFDIASDVPYEFSVLSDMDVPYYMHPGGDGYLQILLEGEAGIPLPSRLHAGDIGTIGDIEGPILVDGQDKIPIGPDGKPVNTSPPPPGKIYKVVMKYKEIKNNRSCSGYNTLTVIFDTRGLNDDWEGNDPKPDPKKILLYHWQFDNPHSTIEDAKASTESEIISNESVSLSNPPITFRMSLEFVGRIVLAIREVGSDFAISVRDIFGVDITDIVFDKTYSSSTRTLFYVSKIPYTPGENSFNIT